MTTTIAKLRRSVVVDVGPLDAAAFCFNGVHVRVESNSRALLERLQGYFAPFLCEPGGKTRLLTVIQKPSPEWELPFRAWKRGSGKRGRKEAVCDLADGRVVRKLRTGMQFLIGQQHLVAVGDCESNDNQVINFLIAQILFCWIDQDAALCHAAGVLFQGQGVMICARSGGGKSTLALHLMSAGATFLSNDRTLLFLDKETAQVAMRGVPKQPRVNPGTLLHNDRLMGVLASDRAEVLRTLPKTQLWDLEEKYDVDVEAIYGSGRWTLTAPLSVVLLLNWRQDAEEEATFRRVSLKQRPDLLGLIMKAPGPFYVEWGKQDAVVQRQSESGSYLRALRGAPVYEATGRVNFAAACEFFSRFADSAGRQTGCDF